MSERTLRLTRTGGEVYGFFPSSMRQANVLDRGCCTSAAMCYKANRHPGIRTTHREAIELPLNSIPCFDIICQRIIEKLSTKGVCSLLSAIAIAASLLDIFWMGCTSRNLIGWSVGQVEESSKMNHRR